MKDSVKKLDVMDFNGMDWKMVLPRSYRIGFYHFRGDYIAWDGHYFIETLSNPEYKALYIDKAGVLYLACRSIGGQNFDASPKDIRLVYLAKDGSVYTYEQELVWRLIRRENSRLQFLGRPSNVTEILNPNRSKSSFNVNYYNWYFRSIWRHMEPEFSKKSLIGEVLGVVFELKRENDVIGTAYYRPHYSDRLKYIIEMADPGFSYREFSLMYAIAMNHAHPFGIRTDNTSRLYIH